MDKHTLLTSSIDYDKARYTIRTAIAYDRQQLDKAIDTEDETGNFAYYYNRIKESVCLAYDYDLLGKREISALLDDCYLTKDRHQFIKDRQIDTDEAIIFTHLEQRLLIKSPYLFEKLQQSKKIDIQVYDYEFDEPILESLKNEREKGVDDLLQSLQNICEHTQIASNGMKTLNDRLDQISAAFEKSGKIAAEKINQVADNVKKATENINKPISQKQEMEIAEIFRQSTVEEGILRLPNVQLDRKTYTEVKKQIEAIGGKWKGGKTQGFIFKDGTDPNTVKEQLANGADLAERKKQYQFFGTPSEVADMILEYLPKECTETGYVYIRDTDKVLEPSAGQGSIINAVHRINPNVTVDCYEAMEENREVLKTLPNVNILGDDFLASDTGVKYDIIVANPPFANNQDIDHVVRMYQHLRPSGTLISIMSPHCIFASDLKSKAFRYFINHETAEVHQIDGGAFAESGTNVKTIFVVINKEADLDFEELQAKVKKEKINERLNNHADLTQAENDG